MKVYNFTPHPIVIKIPGGDDVVIEPSGYTARLEEKLAPAGTIWLEGHVVDLYKRELGEVKIIPTELKLEPGDVVIVSSLVAYTLKEQRPELIVLVPGEPVRDEKGAIIGVKNLFVIEGS